MFDIKNMIKAFVAFFSMLPLSCASELSLSEERVQLLTLTSFKQIEEVADLLIQQKGVNPEAILIGHDWDCFITQTYFKDDLPIDPVIRETVGNLMNRFPSMVITGRWIDERPDAHKVNELIELTFGHESNLSSTLTPLDVFKGYYGLSPDNIIQYCSAHQSAPYIIPHTLKISDICQISAASMDEQTQWLVCQQPIFKGVMIDVRDEEVPYGFCYGPFLFTNGQDDERYKAIGLGRTLDHVDFPVKGIDWILYGDDSLKYLKALRQHFQDNRKENIILLHLPNRNTLS